MAEGLVISTKNGQLRGVQNCSDFSSRLYYSFYGVPYAEPPTGDHRFKPPVKISNWNGIRDANTEGNECLQFSVYDQRVIGSEDCLYLNIHIPEPPRNGRTQRAVIVLLHSGGHLWGAGTTSIHGSPEYLMHHDIIYVTFNYRLHIFGFLNLRIPECPGNVGIKDAIMALEWVKDNIIHFGGDPNNITLIGHCSGASMIHFFMLNPMCKGLYHKVVLMGDYIFNPLMNYQEDTVDIAFEYGKLLGFDGNSAEKLLTFLKSQPALTLQSKLNEMNVYIAKKYGRIFPTAPFLPSVESIEDEAFLTKSPVELIHSINPVPLIFGVCENEAIFAFLDKIKLTPGKKYKRIFKQNCWAWMHNLDSNAMNSIVEKVKSFYFGDKKIYSPSAAVRIYNDAGIAEFYDTVANVILKKSPLTPVYVYFFTHVGNLNKMTEFMGRYASDSIAGTVHADDYFYMVQVKTYKHVKGTEDDIKTIHNLTTFLTKFAKTGDPNDRSIRVKWKPTTIENPSHLILGTKLEVQEGKINHERLKFWEQLKRQFCRDILDNPEENK